MEPVLAYKLVVYYCTDCGVAVDRDNSLLFDNLGIVERIYDVTQLYDGDGDTERPNRTVVRHCATCGKALV